MSEEDCDELLNALDTFRECRDDWERVSNQCGFYDPQGYQEVRAKLDIKDAVVAVDNIICKIVTRVISKVRRDIEGNE